MIKYKGFHIVEMQKNDSLETYFLAMPEDRIEPKFISESWMSDDEPDIIEKSKEEGINQVEREIDEYLREKGMENKYEGTMIIEIPFFSGGNSKEEAVQKAFDEIVHRLDYNDAILKEYDAVEVPEYAI